MNLALNNLQRLICHKTQTTQQPSLSSLPGPLLPGVVATDKISYGSNRTKLNCLKLTSTFNRV